MTDIIDEEQQQLICLLLQNKKFVEGFIDEGLTFQHFNDKYHFLIQCIIEDYEQGVRLTRESFKEKCKECFSSPAQIISQQQIFLDCSLLTGVIADNYPLLIKKIIERNIDRSIKRVLEDFTDKSNKAKSVAQKLIVIEELGEDCHNIAANNISLDEKPLYEDINILLEEEICYIKGVLDGSIIEIPPILCGIKEIDDVISTGLEKGTLTLFVADVGTFKSAIMMNIAMNVWKNGYNVLYVPLEMDKGQVRKRMLSRDARIPYEKLTKKIKELTLADQQKIENIKAEWKQRKGRLFIMQEYKRTSVPNIEKQIKRYIQVFHPKLVVIDYIANLVPHVQRKERNDLEIGDMLKEMRHMGKKWGFAVISAAQLGRGALTRIHKAGTSKDKTAIHSEDIRGSHEYSADADNIFAQLRSSQQANELLDIFCIKSRNGPTTFDGNIKTTLEVQPEYFLIQSLADKGFGTTDGILTDLTEMEVNSDSDDEDILDTSFDTMLPSLDKISHSDDDEEDDWL